MFTPSITIFSPMINNYALAAKKIMTAPIFSRYPNLCSRIFAFAFSFFYAAYTFFQNSVDTTVGQIPLKLIPNSDHSKANTFVNPRPPTLVEL